MCVVLCVESRGGTKKDPRAVVAVVMGAVGAVVLWWRKPRNRAIASPFFLLQCNASMVERRKSSTCSLRS